MRLPGSSWQRCRTHFVRNLLTRVPKSAQAMVATFVRSIFEQPDAETHARNMRVVEQLADRFGDAAMLVDAAPDVLAFAASPKSTGGRSVPTTAERLNKELRRRTDVVGTLQPSRDRGSSARCSPNNTTSGSRAAT